MQVCKFFKGGFTPYKTEESINAYLQEHPSYKVSFVWGIDGISFLVFFDDTEGSKEN